MKRLMFVKFIYVVTLEPMVAAVQCSYVDNSE
jgi:hypothetical protein